MGNCHSVNRSSRRPHKSGSGTNERQPAGPSEQRSREKAGRKVQRGGKGGKPEADEAAIGMMELKGRTILHVHQVPCADPFKKAERLRVARNQQVLSIVDVVAGDGIDVRSRAAAQCGLVFDQKDGDAPEGEIHRGSESGKSTADNYDWTVPALFHSGPRFNQEYFSLWLSQ
jgi:hypothetical protein